MTTAALVRYTTDVVAVAAVSTWLQPSWLDALSDISAFSAKLVPILGCVWLIIQIGGYFLKKDRKP